MNDIDDEAFGEWTKKVPFQDRTPKLAWKAALEWRDGQVGEPFGYFKCEPDGWVDCAETDEGAIALYEVPPTAQINQALIKALEMLINNPFREGTHSSNRLIELAQVALQAARGEG